MPNKQKHQPSPKMDFFHTNLATLKKMDRGDQLFFIATNI